MRGSDLAESACICNSSVPPPPQTEVISNCTVHRSSSRRFPQCQLGQSAAFLPSPPPAQRTANACRALFYPYCLPFFCLFVCLLYLPCVSLCKIPSLSSVWCVYMCQGLLLRRNRKVSFSHKTGMKCLFFFKFLFFLKLPFGFFGSFSSSSAVLDHIPESVSSAKNDCTSALLDKTEIVSQ